MINQNKWKLAILKQAYEPFSLNKEYNVLAQVKLVQKDEDNEELNYYEAIIPEFNFVSIFINKSKIKEFL